MHLLTPKKQWWQFWMKRCVSCGGAYTNYGIPNAIECLPCEIKSGYKIGAIAPDDPETPAAFRTILSLMLSAGILQEREPAVTDSRKSASATLPAGLPRHQHLTTYARTQEDAILEALSNGQRVLAMKLCRELYGGTMQEAKHFIDGFSGSVQGPTPTPSRPSPAQHGGAASQSKKASDPIFLPTCLNCDRPMEKVEDWGMGMQGGSCSCPHCGEPHNYHIVSGVLALKRVSVPRGNAGPVHKEFRHHRQGGV
jgi:ribosomal protein L7/L12